MNKTNPFSNAEAEFKKVSKALADLAAEKLAHIKAGDALNARETVLLEQQSEISQLFHLAEKYLNVAVPEGGAKAAPKRAALSYKDTIELAVFELLQGGAWMQTRDLIDKMKSQGIEIRGDTIQKQVTRIAVILSQSDKFKTARSKGWAFKTEKSAHPKTDARGKASSRAAVGAAA